MRSLCSSFVVVVAALLVAVAVADDAVKVEMVEARVVELSGSLEELRSIHKSPRPVLLMFYAPWCGHCRDVAPVYHSLAGVLKNHVQVTKIDATQPTAHKFTQMFGVTGFPTIFLIANAHAYRHEGGRTQNDLVNFALNEYELATTSFELRIDDPLRLSLASLNELLDYWARHPAMMALVVVAIGLVIGFVVGLVIWCYVWPARDDDADDYVVADKDAAGKQRSVADKQAVKDARLQQCIGTEVDRMMGDADATADATAATSATKTKSDVSAKRKTK